MLFDDLDRKMRAFETGLDQIVLPENYIVVRLDGRGFTRLTKESLNFEKPFDVRFRDCMIQTVNHLMGCGFRIIYGYVQSDEISLLFHQHDNLFERKTRKILSVLAGEASAKFTLTLGHMGVFDCRISPLPNQNLVVDYFRWRAEDAHRNSLNAYCYWKLRETGKGKNDATRQLTGMSVSDKNELLFGFGINYNDLPAWQKRGMGFYYEQYVKKAFNPKKQEEVATTRRVLTCNQELPEAYSQFVLQRINHSEYNLLTF